MQRSPRESFPERAANTPKGQCSSKRSSRTKALYCNEHKRSSASQVPSQVNDLCSHSSGLANSLAPKKYTKNLEINKIPMASILEVKSLRSNSWPKQNKANPEEPILTLFGNLSAEIKLRIKMVEKNWKDVLFFLGKYKTINRMLKIKWKIES